ncbi:MAG: hypothetical protein LUG93_16415, partial [Lachnospiraceae bacterium]|nr:hypothetical protein [Lachnospiraceae bacterium]
TTLYFITGTETEFKGNENPAYKNRHLVHKKYNSLAQEVCELYRNTYLFDVNRYITKENDFTNSPNHYQRKVYYSMAADIIEIVNEATGSSIRTANLKVAEVRKYIRLVFRKLRRILTK